MSNINLKKKIINKINDLLVKKNKDNYDNIAKSFNKYLFFSEIVKKIMIKDVKPESLDYNINNKIFFIVTGFYSVGKTSLLDHIEIFFGDSYTESKINIKTKDEITIINNIINTTNINPKIIYIETKPDIIKDIYELINLNQTYILYVIPKNIQIYKNRLINKFFSNSKLNTYPLNSIGDNFNEIINNMNWDPNSYANINFKFKNYVNDSDFDFLDLDLSKSIEQINQFNFCDDQINKITIKYYF